MTGVSRRSDRWMMTPVPFAAYAPPVKMDIDTRRLIDGVHSLRIVDVSSTGRESIQTIPFAVRNGPAISVIDLDVLFIRLASDYRFKVVFSNERNTLFLRRG